MRTCASGEQEGDVNLVEAKDPLRQLSLLGVAPYVLKQ
jgi:hypothetical protein